MLAEELLLSIDEEGREAIDAAWLAEAKRRDAAFQKGNATAKPIESVIERLKSRVPNPFPL